VVGKNFDLVTTRRERRQRRFLFARDQLCPIDIHCLSQSRQSKVNSWHGAAGLLGDWYELFLRRASIKCRRLRNLREAAWRGFLERGVAW